MSRLRESLTLVLITLLPFHALLVTVGTKMLVGPGHAPMTMLAGWKEGLLAVILLIAALEFLRKPSFKIDLIDGLIIALLALAFIIPSTNFLFGFKYDFIPLVAFLILRRVAWSDWFWMRAESALLFVGGIVAAYGILTFFLPDSFFAFLGYSDAHSLYLPDRPLAAFQQISGSSIRRIQSTFSGPNQFGIWLLIPLAIVASYGLRVMRNPKPETRNSKLFQMLVVCGLMLVALFLSFSRSAWIATFVLACVTASSLVPRRIFPQMLTGILAIVMIVGVALSVLAPAVFVRKISLIGHIERPIQAMQLIMQNPLGMGLGSAGPASNRTHEPCVHLERGADPSWAKSNPSLCVFVGKTQVQPADHVCSCPVLPENWYLQVGVEMGVLGFLLYGGLIFLILRRLAVISGKRKEESDKNIFHFPLSTFLFFLGISIAALFLHAWEDSAVAYTAWVVVAVALTKKAGFTFRENNISHATKT